LTFFTLIKFVKHCAVFALVESRKGKSILSFEINGFFAFFYRANNQLKVF